MLVVNIQTGLDWIESAKIDRRATLGLFRGRFSLAK